MKEPLLIPEHLRWLDDAARALYEAAVRFCLGNGGTPNIPWGWRRMGDGPRDWPEMLSVHPGWCFYAAMALEGCQPTRAQIAAAAAWAREQARAHGEVVTQPNERRYHSNFAFTCLAEEAERVSLIAAECLRVTPAGDFINPEGEVVVKAGEEFPKTPRARDLRRCQALYSDAQQRAEQSGDNLATVEAASREEQDLSLALHLHNGDVAARTEVNRRVGVLAGYLLLRGGTNFLKDCRAAIAEERWGDVVQRIGNLEDELVRDKCLRWTLHESGDFRAEPMGEAHWHIPTNIDVGGPLL